MSTYHRIAFGPRVRAAQHDDGSRASYARIEAAGDGTMLLGREERAFLASTDGFYLASLTETGWPYVQYRGGPPGFLRVLGETRLGFADLRGNRQLISIGNTRADDRVSLFVMDYAELRRLKLFGRLRSVAVGDDPDLAARLLVEPPEGHVERLVTIDVEGYDWNCPQHIARRFTIAQIDDAVRPLRERIAELEARLREATNTA